MGWIVRHKRHGIVLALFALALQIVLAFDHVHLPGLAHNARATISHSTAAQTTPQAPAQIPGDDDGYCAICASIFLASSALAATPPVLPPSPTFQRSDDFIYSGATLAERAQLAFRSRAPPAV